MANIARIGSNTFWRITADFGDVDRQIDDKVAKIEYTHEMLEELEKDASKTIRRVMVAARGGWGIIQAMVRMSGGAISMTTRLVMSAVMGGVQTLIPLLAAAKAGGFATLNAAQVLAATMGMMEVGSSLLALGAYRSQQRNLSLQLRGMNFMFSNMSSMMNSYL